MSIREIIEAATEGPWYISNRPKDKAVLIKGGEYGHKIARMYLRSNQHNNTKFIAAFDPEHVAKTEAVVEAAKEVWSLIDEHGANILPHLFDTDENAGQKLRDSFAELDEYRKEHNLL